MPVQSIGDLAQNFQSARQTGQIKTQLNKLAQEMASGQVRDVTTHLRGDTTGLSSLSREISIYQGFAQSARETAQTLDQMQTTLQGLDTLRDALSQRFLSVTTESLPLQVDDAGKVGRQGFADLVNGINRRLGDRSLFAGTAVDGQALADAETMLADIVAAVGPATSSADVKTAIDDWFNTPGGGFETTGYLGATTGEVRRQIGANQSVVIDGRADDPALRELLQSAAIVAVADVMSGAIDARTKAELVADAGVGLLSSGTSLAYLQGRLGEVEGLAASAEATNASQLSAFQMARSDMIAADPFETATRLQDVQRQLELSFTVTARLSRLTLADYI